MIGAHSWVMDRVRFTDRSAPFVRLTLTACIFLLGAQGQVNPKTTLPPNTALFPGTEQVRPEPPPALTELRLERTRCRATCPAYTVTLRADGSFRYTGVYGVERLGEHTGRVEVGSLRQVLRYAEEIGFFGLEPRYTSPYLDNAAAIFTATGPEGRKTVTDYANSGPATLWALGQLIDGLLTDATWDLGGGAR